MNQKGFLTAILFAAISATSVLDRPAKGAESASPAAGRHSDRSYYVPMPDGTMIAVSTYFPDGAPTTKRLTGVLMQTRYGRAGMGVWPRTSRWLADGYAVVAVDTRGSTASFGLRMTELSPDEIRDMDVLIRHIAAQPWSDGRVIAAGQSYAADTADLATSRPVDALLGAVIHETDFDVYLNIMAPGGVVNRGFLSAWGALTRKMDLGLGLAASGAGQNLNCRVRAEDCSKLYPILQPVDDDLDFSQVRHALSQKYRWTPEDLLNLAFRDDKGHNGFSLLEMSPGAAVSGIRTQRKPVQYWGSWMDAGTADAALARFRSAPDVPMEVWITANDHNNFQNADPFSPTRAEPVPARSQQDELQTNFGRRLVAGTRIERQVHYYVLGTGEMQSTPVWPPVGVSNRTYFLASSHSLVARSVGTGTDAYTVDFDASTGKETRWSTQIGVPPRYLDRRAMDARLLTYDSQPLDRAEDIIGTPVLDLNVESRTDDPAFFAYLEDVAPDGTVTYLTEGMLRAIHRKIADAASLPYDQGPAPHSFRRLDAELVTPEVAMQVRFSLFPVAARIRAGHHIRLALAGADAPLFTRYSNGTADTYTVHRGGAAASRIDLPIRPAP